MKNPFYLWRSISAMLIYIFASPSVETFGQAKQIPLANEIMSRVSQAIHDCSPCRYGAKMGFQYFGTDTFEMRHFDVYYTDNALNLLYGYDWGVIEVSAEDTMSIVAITNGMYMASSNNHMIMHQPLPDRIGYGNYTETMRYYFILERIAEPFIDIPDENIIVSDAGAYFKLTRQTGETTTRDLLVDKQSFLPVQYTATDQDLSYGLTQKQIVDFDYKHAAVFPASIPMLPEYLISHGHEYIRAERKTEDETTAPAAEMTEAQAGQLLHYPFVSSTGDTVLIKATNAPYVLLDFWHSSCAPCLKSMPAINQLAMNYKNKGLAVIAINCLDLDKWKTIAPKMIAKSPDLKYYFGERAILFDIGIQAFPTYSLIYPDRTVEFIHGDSSKVASVIAAIMD